MGVISDTALLTGAEMLGVEHNVKFSPHAARKPMMARQRQMPNGRLQFIVGPSLPPLTFCNLPKLPGCGIRTAQTNVLRAPGNYFGAEAPGG